MHSLTPSADLQSQENATGRRSLPSGDLHRRRPACGHRISLPDSALYGAGGYRDGVTRGADVVYGI